MKKISMILVLFVLTACSNRTNTAQQNPNAVIPVLDPMVIPYPNYEDEPEKTKQKQTGDTTSILTIPPVNPTTNTRTPEDREATLPSIKDHLAYRKITMHRSGEEAIHYILQPRVHGNHFHYSLKLKKYKAKDLNLEFVFLETTSIHAEIESLFTQDTELGSSDSSLHPSGEAEQVILYSSSDERTEVKNPVPSGFYPEVFESIQAYLDHYFGTPESREPKDDSVPNDDSIQEGSTVSLGCEKFPSLEGTWKSVLPQEVDTITMISRIQFERDSTLNANRDVYIGEDEMTIQNGEETTVKRTAVTYKYNTKTCEVKQKKNGESTMLTVHSVETKKDGKRIVRFRMKNGSIFKIEEL